MLNPFTKIKDARRRKAVQARSGAAPAAKASPEGSTLKKNEKFLIQNFNGVVKSGEMAFVVGRPGAGCTTFLKAVTNVRDGYAGVDGDVKFGSMDAKQAQKYPGQIIFNQEDDTHFPTLSVEQTLKFGLKMKTPSSRPEGVSREEYEKAYLDTILKTLGIDHTRQTLVGNEVRAFPARAPHRAIRLTPSPLCAGSSCEECLAASASASRSPRSSSTVSRRPATLSVSLAVG